MSSIGDDERTRQSVLPAPAADEQPTAAHSDVGIAAELRAVFGTGEKKTLPLYALPDQIVVGRGTASDWQLDDPSLSRKHCQFRWNGKLLTVEDLGSANGTRVGGRSARQPLPVTADDVVQLGTVMISFVPLRPQQANGRDVDAEATKLVHALPAGGAGETTPSPMPAGPTRVTAVTPARGAPAMRAVPPSRAATQETPIPKAGAAGPPNARAAVFHPERDAAGPEDETRQWDPAAALVHAPERNLDAGELIARAKAAWRTNRRPFVLGGAALWIALLLGLIALKQPKQSEDDAIPIPQKSAVAPAGSGEPDKPVVTQLDRSKVPGAPPSAEAVEASADRDQDLADAVAAYDNGRPQEALKFFRRLAADPNDKAARFMVRMIESRGTAP
ncbi:MAG: hypothetical protein JWN44_2022 [Myxococcales bacterium]|nr:hypothetical protein [Myxococcales bacterium]